MRKVKQTHVKGRKLSIYHAVIFSFCLLLFCTGQRSFSQTFPTAAELAEEMRIGWNIGNTMEALYENNGSIVAGETAWGNPLITQTLIDGVKAAGFNTIRIPIAWDVHTTNGTIDPQWLARVKTVVDYCYNQDLYVMINIHWDNGWLEENCTLAMQAVNNTKQANYWNQIATYFKDYDEHLLFASANEPHVADATEMAVLLSYHQTFVNTVRASGGNNDQRILIVQGPATDIEKTNNLMNTMPTDPSPGRMMAEVHFYPYQFSLMQADESWGNQFYYWGACNHSTTDQAHNPTWGEEAYVDEMFQLMKTKFVDQGYPVILGEFGAKLRTNLTGANFNLHKRSREYFLKYVTRSALNHGIIPVYWCAGLGELFNRNTGAALEPGTVNALMAGAYTKSTTVNCGNNDCQGTPYGHAYTNECNDCVLGVDLSCANPTTDCNGVENGTASIDNCGECSGGNTGVTPNSTCEQDCNGNWGGTASLDDCGVCSGGNTGVVPNASCCNFDVVNDTICEPGMVNLSVSGGSGEYEWYDAPENGSLLTTGATYSPTISTNKTFYVGGVSGTTETIGLSSVTGDSWADNTFGNSDKVTVVTVSSEVTIEAIAVFVTVNGTNVTLNITEQGGAGFTASATSTGLSTGKQRIETNFTLAPGTYILDAVGTTQSLTFQSSGATFPYSLSGVLEFTYNASWASTWYGFFYDWELSTGSSCVRTPVHAIIDPDHADCVEIDTDNDGTPDDEDACPDDPNKALSVGECGCGIADTDTDADGIADCNDAFPDDFDNDGISSTDDCDDTNDAIGAATTWYEDADGDGLGDANVTQSACTQPANFVAASGDNCPNDINKTDPGNCGCRATEESCLDCAGIPNGTTEFDDCGVCGGTNACVDCNGVPNGEAYLDNCANCVEGNTGNTACEQDCHGDWGGTATIDACNECTGGNTGLPVITDPQQCIATGVNGQTSTNEIGLYPNPTTGELYLTKATSWYLFNTQGEEILRGDASYLNLSSYPKGMYFLKINGVVMKVVKE